MSGYIVEYHSSTFACLLLNFPQITSCGGSGTFHSVWASYTKPETPRIYLLVPYMVTDRDAQGIGVVMLKIYGTARDLQQISYGPLQNAMNWFTDEKIAPRIGLMTVF